jgi:hypothetical protein
VVLLAAVVTTAVDKLRAGTPGELWWACHVASAALAAATLLRWDRAADGAGLLLLAVGVPGWLVELAAHGATRPASTAEHLVGPLVALASWRRGGLARTAVPEAIALWSACALGARACTDPALNVNLTAAPFDGWPPGTPTAVSFAGSTVAAAALAWIVDRGVAGRFGRRPG